MINRNLLSQFNGNLSASKQAFDGLEKSLPDDYIEFLAYCNGGEGFIGENSYVIFWTVEELPEMNEAYEVSKYAKELFLFGSDGGGEAYGFDTRSSPATIVQVPFVGMDTSLAQYIADDFSSFLQYLHDDKD
jgi:hypothetical protein